MNVDGFATVPPVAPTVPLRMTDTPVAHRRSISSVGLGRSEVRIE
jgi:hypothetical protein